MLPKSISLSGEETIFIIFILLVDFYFNEGMKRVSLLEVFNQRRRNEASLIYGKTLGHFNH